MPQTQEQHCKEKTKMLVSSSWLLEAVDDTDDDTDDFVFALITLHRKINEKVSREMVGNIIVMRI